MGYNQNQIVQFMLSYANVRVLKEDLGKRLAKAQNQEEDLVMTPDKTQSYLQDIRNYRAIVPEGIRRKINQWSIGIKESELEKLETLLKRRKR